MQAHIVLLAILHCFDIGFAASRGVRQSMAKHYGDTCPTLVEISTGFVKGVQFKVLGKRVNAFLGIPYAKSPSGERRFKKPEVPDPWANVLAVSKVRSGCAAMISTPSPSPWISDSVILNEDCLHLNVWTSCDDSSHGRVNEKKPVMVWFYGGQFLVGSSDVKYYDGSVLAAYGGVVVVSFDYRVGLFGFLSSDFKEVPGNMGLYDQIMALQWIRKNIEVFGGDPNSVTLFGHSSGADSIGYHLTMPSTQNLFKRAILQSGSFLEPIILTHPTENVEKGNLLATKVGCADDERTLFTDAEDVINCLRQIDTLTLLKAQELIVKEKGAPLSPVFTKDGLFPEHPHAAYFAGDTGQPKDILMGVVRDEGSAILGYFRPSLLDSDLPNITTADAEEIIVSSFAFLPRSLTRLIAREYLTHAQSDDPENIIKSTYDAIGDCLITCPCLLSAQAVSKNDSHLRMYFYLFGHRPAKTPWRAKWTGVAHFDEVQFVFGYPLIHPRNYTATEQELSARIMETWTHFAKTGKTLTQMGLTWPPYTQEDPVIMEITTRKASLRKHFKEKACDFWKFFFDNARRLLW